MEGRAGGEELLLHHCLHHLPLGGAGEDRPVPVSDLPAPGTGTCRARELLLVVGEPPEGTAKPKEHGEEDEDDKDYHRKVRH